MNSCAHGCFSSEESLVRNLWYTFLSSSLIETVPNTNTEILPLTSWHCISWENLLTSCRVQAQQTVHHLWVVLVFYQQALWTGPDWTGGHSYSNHIHVWTNVKVNIINNIHMGAMKREDESSSTPFSGIKVMLLYKPIIKTRQKFFITE